VKVKAKVKTRMTSTSTLTSPVPPRCLVTGGAGFIGSELVRQLAATGCDVTVVDNLVNGERDNVSEVLCDGVRLEVADIRDASLMGRLLQKTDVVYHLACLGVRHSIHSPEENHEVNASATLTLLLRAREAKVKRFVYVSSSEVYGTAQRVPMTEDYPPSPNTVYGSSKLAGDCYTRALWRTYGYPTVVVRPFNCYGPRSHHEGDSGEVIPKFLLRTMAAQPMVIHGDGTQTRDFTYVEDAARGILHAGTTDAAVGETINLGQGSEISINSLAELVKRVLKKPEAKTEHADPRPGDVLRLCADISKARSLLGYKPTVSLADGLTRLKSWYEAQDIPPEELLRKERVKTWEPAEGR
jgi:UDP-glucose 4-epimerase